MPPNDQLLQVLEDRHAKVVELESLKQTTVNPMELADAYHCLGDVLDDSPSGGMLDGIIIWH
jgi:hypothetical protein